VVFARPITTVVRASIVVAALRVASRAIVAWTSGVACIAAVIAPGIARVALASVARRTIVVPAGPASRVPLVAAARVAPLPVVFVAANVARVSVAPVAGLWTRPQFVAMRARRRTTAILVPPASAARASLIAQWITMGWRVPLAFGRGAVLPAVVTPANLLLETLPLCLFGVTIFLSRVAVFAAWAPILVAGGLVGGTRLTARAACALTVTPRSAITVALAFGARPLPSAFSLTESRIARRVSRVEQLPPLKPFQRDRRVLFFQAVQCWKQLFRIVRAKGGGLIVDKDRPVRMSRRHRAMIAWADGAGDRTRR
jgi:hypothetical protein